MCGRCCPPAPADAAGCAFEPQGEGRVAAIDRCAHLPPRRRPRGPPRRHRAGRDRKGQRAASALSAIIAGRDVTLRGEDDTPDRYGRQPAFVFLARSETSVQGHASGAGRGAGLGRCDRQGLCLGPDGRGGRAAPGQTWNLGRSRGHKKRGKSGRYFGRESGVLRWSKAGFVRPTGGGNDLPEFRAELDTGLCCDYFKAHGAGVRGCRNWR